MSILMRGTLEISSPFKGPTFFLPLGVKIVLIHKEKNIVWS